MSELNLTPYQIRREDGEVWIERTDTNQQFGRDKETPAYLKRLQKLQAKHNSNHALTMMGL